VTTSGEPDAASAASVVRYLVTGMLDTDTKVRDAAEISWQILRERCAAGTVDRDGVGAALAACVDSRPVADRLRGELESG